MPVSFESHSDVNDTGGGGTSNKDAGIGSMDNAAASSQKSPSASSSPSTSSSSASSGNSASGISPETMSKAKERSSQKDDSDNEDRTKKSGDSELSFSATPDPATKSAMDQITALADGPVSFAVSEQASEQTSNTGMSVASSLPLSVGVSTSPTESESMSVPLALSRSDDDSNDSAQTFDEYIASHPDEVSWLQTVGERILPSLGATATMNKVMGGVGSAIAAPFPDVIELPIRAAVGSFTSRVVWPGFKKPQDELSREIGVEPIDPAEDWFDEGDLLPGFFSAGASLLTARAIENVLGPAQMSTWAGYGKALLGTTAVSSAVFVAADAIGRALYENVKPYRDLADAMDTQLAQTVDEVVDLAGDVYADGPAAIADRVTDLTTPTVDPWPVDAPDLQQQPTAAEQAKQIERIEAYEEYVSKYGSPTSEDGLALPVRHDAPTFEEFFAARQVQTQEAVEQQMLADFMPEREQAPSVADDAPGQILSPQPGVGPAVPDPINQAPEQRTPDRLEQPSEPDARPDIQDPAQPARPPSVMASSGDEFEFTHQLDDRPLDWGTFDAEPSEPGGSDRNESDSDQFVFLPCLQVGDSIAVAIKCFEASTGNSLALGQLPGTIIEQYFGSDRQFDGGRAELYNELLALAKDDPVDALFA
jgi:hypothetical protein